MSPASSSDEPTPPYELAAIQSAFGRAISTPLLFDDESDDVAVQVGLYDASIAAEMVPRPPASGVERLAVYNRQYWYRLFNTLQEEFPLLCALMGPRSFNRMASRYVSRRSSRSPLLQDLGKWLPGYLEEEPGILGDLVDDSPMLIQAARLDRGYAESFGAGERRALDEAAAARMGEGLAGRRLRMQPHWFLFEEDWDLVESRRKVLKDRDTEVRPVARSSAWAAWRSSSGMVEERVTAPQAALLRMMASGRSVREACDQLASSLSGEEWEEVSGGIGGWFATWRERGWFLMPE